MARGIPDRPNWGSMDVWQRETNPVVPDEVAEAIAYETPTEARTINLAPQTADDPVIEAKTNEQGVTVD